MKHITREGLKKLIATKADFTLLCAVTKEEFEQGHIPGSINIPWREITLTDQEARIPKDKAVVVYCSSFTCNASAKAAQILEMLKYKVIEYDGGIDDWADDTTNLLHKHEENGIQCDC